MKIIQINLNIFAREILPAAIVSGYQQIVSVKFNVLGVLLVHQGDVP
jgi:hypothetical protein